MGVKLGISYLSKEHMITMFEYRVLRKVFGPKRLGEVTWELRKLHSGEFTIGAPFG
jgi:hypothetical protein